MKTTVALVIALVTLLPDSANATTLTITSGSAVLNSEVGPGGEGSVISFGRNDFSVYQTQEPASFEFSRASVLSPSCCRHRFIPDFFVELLMYGSELNTVMAAILCLVVISRSRAPASRCLPIGRSTLHSWRLCRSRRPASCSSEATSTT